ncbi:hypothetical protein [Demequina muriae]|uniref:Zinc-ribbon domain-containing protein n=1 Tax=Demequina muriae TaxID=3051664 RepID=A0ABT8GJ23_9MICO|nr:hypothetical protein [Demequina sp. EGI L300058]MDN4481438.1 hypothetical protein [Demequina sp. EGI L300058]
MTDYSREDAFEALGAARDSGSRRRCRECGFVNAGTTVSCVSCGADLVNHGGGATTTEGRVSPYSYADFESRGRFRGPAGAHNRSIGKHRLANLQASLLAVAIVLGAGGLAVLGASDNLALGSTLLIVSVVIGVGLRVWSIAEIASVRHDGDGLPLR